MSEWISVKYALPEVGEKVICFGREWGVNFARFDWGFDGRPEFSNVRAGCMDNPHVSHWMPLPAPPEVHP